MTDRLDLQPRHREYLEALLREHVPDTEVWAYGSRVNGRSHEGSDLDLVVRGPELEPLGSEFLDLLAAIQESNIPILVQAHDWARLPESFHQEIQRDYVVVQGDAEQEPSGPSQQSSFYRPDFPSHWNRQPLYSLAQWTNGLAFRNIQFSPTGKPVIKIGEIKGGVSDRTKLTDQDFDDSVRVRSGDLLFSWSGQPETSIDAFRWNGPEGWLNQHIFRVTAKNNIDTTFFYYLLRYLKPNFVGIARNKQTTGLGHVTKRDLQNIEAAVPPPEEQREIARVLGALDDKIELNRRMCETLEEMAQALFKSWFVDFEPVRAKMDGRWRRGESLPGLPSEHYDLFPNRLVPSELGPIPEGWQTATFGHLADRSRASIQPGKFPEVKFLYFSIPAYDDAQVARQELGVTIKSTKTVVEPNAVLVSKLNPDIERVWLVDAQNNDQSICSTEFLVLRARPPLGRGYLYALTRSPSFQRGLQSLATGTSKSHQRARPEAIFSLPVTIPPAPLATMFECQVDAPLQQMLLYRQDQGHLAGVRDALLPKLVSGEVRVSEVVEMV